MTTVIPNGHAQVSQYFTLTGAPHPFAVVTGHVVSNAGYTADDVAAAVSNGWFTWWDDFARSTAWRLDITKALYRTPAGVLTAGEDPITNAGTDPAQTSPVANAAILVRKRTGIAGRTFRGRMFVPTFALAEANVSPAGIIDGALVTQIQTAIDVMVARWVTDQVTPRLLHGDATPPTPITSHQVQARMATQRRRLRS